MSKDYIIKFKGFKPTETLRLKTLEYINTLKLLGAIEIKVMLWIEPHPSMFPIQFSDEDFPTEITDQGVFQDNYLLDEPRLNVGERPWKKCQVSHKLDIFKFNVGYQSLNSWEECLQGTFSDTLDRTIRAMSKKGLPINNFRSKLKVTTQSPKTTN